MEILNPNYVSKLLFLSYHYSQGKEDIQEQILSYIKYKFPEYRINNSNIIEIAEIVDKKINNFFRQNNPYNEILNHKINVDRSKQNLDILRILTYFKQSLNNSEPPNNPIEKITHYLLRRDIRYLASGRPRVGIIENQIISPANNPYLSHIHFYGICAHPTGAIEFDTMFQDIVITIQNSAPKSQIRSKFRELSIISQKIPDIFATNQTF